VACSAPCTDPAKFWLTWRAASIAARGYCGDICIDSGNAKRLQYVINQGCAAADAAPRLLRERVGLRQKTEHMNPVVTSVSRSGQHTFTKPVVPTIRLVPGLGVEGDAHLGEKVKHRSRVRKNPDDPNLRQVHLIHEELFAELRRGGFDLDPGAIGENVTTRGIDLLGLPTGTRLRLGPDAVVEITGLRNPCGQLDAFRPGLMQAVLGRDAGGRLVRKSGVMAIVISGGDVKAGDAITVELPAGERRPLLPV
jgi:MOSC domain-containing protein YiiM